MNEVIRISISETARLFGLNSQTIRRAIKTGELPAIVVQGRYKVDFETALKWSQIHSTTKNKLSSRGIGQFVNEWRPTIKQAELPTPTEPEAPEEPTAEAKPKAPRRKLGPRTDISQQALPF